MKIIVLSFPDTADLSVYKVGDSVIIGEVQIVGKTTTGTVVITANIPNPDNT